MCRRSVFLVQIFRRTSVHYNSGVQTDCLYNECISKRCSFQRKIFTCEVALFGLFQNRLLHSARLALKRKVRLTYTQTRVWLQRIEIVRRSIVSARLELRRVYFRVLFGFYRRSFHLFCLYRHACGLCCKLSSESFEIIINSGRIWNRRLWCGKVKI